MFPYLFEQNNVLPSQSCLIRQRGKDRDDRGYYNRKIDGTRRGAARVARSLKFITSRFITSNGAHLREARGPIIKSFNRMSLAWIPGLLTGYEAKKYART